MPAHLLVLTVVSLMALAALAVIVRLVACAVAELHDELRRSSAVMEAGDELLRTATAVGDHAERTRVEADRVLSRMQFGVRIIRRWWHR